MVLRPQGGFWGFKTHPLSLASQTQGCGRRRQPDWLKEIIERIRYFEEEVSQSGKGTDSRVAQALV